jgi:hypothetical protein
LAVLFAVVVVLVVVVNTQDPPFAAGLPFVAGPPFVAERPFVGGLHVVRCGVVGGAAVMVCEFEFLLQDHPQMKTFYTYCYKIKIIFLRTKIKNFGVFNFKHSIFTIISKKYKKHNKQNQDNHVEIPFFWNLWRF